MTSADFDWGDDGECVVLPLQPRTATYFNPQGTVVIRQEGQHGGEDEDAIILVTPDNAEALAAAIISTAKEAREVIPQVRRSGTSPNRGSPRPPRSDGAMLLLELAAASR